MNVVTRRNKASRSPLWEHRTLPTKKKFWLYIHFKIKSVLRILLKMLVAYMLTLELSESLNSVESVEIFSMKGPVGTTWLAFC